MEVYDEIKLQAEHIVSNYIGEALLAKLIEFGENWYMHGSADCYVRMMNKKPEPLDNTESK